jgi:hypothetical protein
MYDQHERSDKKHSRIDGTRIISYNFTEGERPRRLKVRAKIRIVKGREAEAVNAAQAEVIRELLLWARQRRQAQQQ